LPTKDHFSSNWTSRVWGGKSHECVVELLGVLTGDESEADDGVFVDTCEASGLANATGLLEVVEDGEGFGFGEFGVEEGGAFAFGEARLTGAASEHAALLGGAVAKGDPKVVGIAFAEVGALGILATEDFQVVHGWLVSFRATEKGGPPLELP
jgi:hypothetical protein